MNELAYKLTLARQQNRRAAALLHPNMHKYRKSVLSEMVRARAQPLFMRF